MDDLRKYLEIGRDILAWSRRRSATLLAGSYISTLGGLAPRMTSSPTSKQSLYLAFENEATHATNEKLHIPTTKS